MRVLLILFLTISAALADCSCSSGVCTSGGCCYSIQDCINQGYSYCDFSDPFYVTGAPYTCKSNAFCRTHSDCIALGLTDYYCDYNSYNCVKQGFFFSTESPSYDVSDGFCYTGLVSNEAESPVIDPDLDIDCCFQAGGNYAGYVPSDVSKSCCGDSDSNNYWSVTNEAIRFACVNGVVYLDKDTEFNTQYNYYYSSAYINADLNYNICAASGGYWRGAGGEKNCCTRTKGAAENWNVPGSLGACVNGVWVSNACYSDSDCPPTNNCQNTGSVPVADVAGYGMRMTNKCVNSVCVNSGEYIVGLCDVECITDNDCDIDHVSGTTFQTSGRGIDCGMFTEISITRPVYMNVSTCFDYYERTGYPKVGGTTIFDYSSAEAATYFYQPVCINYKCFSKPYGDTSSTDYKNKISGAIYYVDHLPGPVYSCIRAACHAGSNCADCACSISGNDRYESAYPNNLQPDGCYHSNVCGGWTAPVKFAVFAWCAPGKYGTAELKNCGSDMHKCKIWFYLRPTQISTNRGTKTILYKTGGAILQCLSGTIYDKYEVTEHRAGPWTYFGYVSGSTSWYIGQELIRGHYVDQYKSISYEKPDCGRCAGDYDC